MLNSTNTKLSLEKTNLYDIAKNSIDLNQILFDRSNFKIKNNISKDIYVKSNKLRLEELFTNLFSNSIKYTDKDGIIILNAVLKDEFVVVSIKDNGLGLTEDQISNIFNEFYKVDESRHNIDSSGLGMSICRQIVKQHGGSIWIESDGIGKGSTVFFTIPITDVNNYSIIEDIHYEIDNEI
jgi:signal transduction histidine kinase